MKKQFLIFLFLISGSISYSQQKEYGLNDFYNLKNGKVNYTDIISVDSANANKLYSRAIKWIYDTFNSGKDVIQYEDKENNRIMCKGNLTATWQPLRATTVIVSFKIEIATKDNKFRYEISEFTTQTPALPKEPLESWGDGALKRKSIRDLHTEIQNKLKYLINSLSNAMTIKSKDEEF